MNYRFFACTVAACSILASAATADVIGDRKAMMKSVGEAAKVSAQMVKGQVEYDPAKAALAMRVIQAAGIGLPGLFPAGTESGGETEAAAKIWEDPDGFAASSAKMASAAGDAVAASATADGFKAAFGPVVTNCKACHESYRISKK